MKDNKCIEPDAIYAEDDSLVAYWVEGHEDKQQFAIGCNKVYDCANHSGAVSVPDVIHRHAVKTEYPDGSYWLEFGQGEGAIPITCVEV